MSSDSTSPSTANQLARQRTDMSADRTRWAADRTFLAADRTLIAWVRTAISLVGFGISIGKAGEALESRGILLDSFHGLQLVGTAFISLAVLGLVGAVLQDRRVEKRLARQGYGRVEPVPLGLVMAILVLFVAIAGIIFVLT